MYVCKLMPLSLPHVLILYIFYTYMMTTGADPGAAGGAPGERAPKIEKNMIFWRKIVIFHTKYPKHFRASLHSALFLFIKKLPIRSRALC